MDGTEDIIGDGGDGGKMPLLDHLIELRQRLLYSVAGIFVAFAFCFYFAGEIFDFLSEPLYNAMNHDPDRRMIYTALHEVFITQIKIGLFGALFLAFPVISSQMWMFVAPGLYKKEKKAFLPFLVATPVLFVTGAALAYYVIFPLAWSFFLGFETIGGNALPIQMEPRVGDYLPLVMQIIFAFGLCFELPVLLTLMARAGLVTSKGLKEKRKYAIVITFAAAAFLTPPDIISQIGLGIPILLLYEISILSARMVERRKQADDDDVAGDVGDEADAP